MNIVFFVIVSVLSLVVGILLSTPLKKGWAISGLKAIEFALFKAHRWSVTTEIKLSGITYVAHVDHIHGGMTVVLSEAKGSKKLVYFYVSNTQQASGYSTDASLSRTPLKLSGEHKTLNEAAKRFSRRLSKSY